MDYEKLLQKADDVANSSEYLWTHNQNHVALASGLYTAWQTNGCSASGLESMITGLYTDSISLLGESETHKDLVNQLVIDMGEFSCP